MSEELNIVQFCELLKSKEFVRETSHDGNVSFAVDVYDPAATIGFEYPGTGALYGDQKAHFSINAAICILEEDGNPEYFLFRKMAEKHRLDFRVESQYYIVPLTRQGLESGYNALVEFHQRYQEALSTQRAVQLSKEMDRLHSEFQRLHDKRDKEVMRNLESMF